jgi:hypothetical protein
MLLRPLTCAYFVETRRVSLLTVEGRTIGEVAVRAGRPGSESAFSSAASRRTALRGTGVPLRPGIQALPFKSGSRTRSRSAAQRLPGAKHWFENGSRPQRSPASSNLRGAMYFGYCANTSGATTTRSPSRRSTSPRCWARAASTVTLGARALQRAGLIRYREHAETGVQPYRGWRRLRRSATSGCSRAPMSDSWRPSMSRTSPGAGLDLFSMEPDGTLACVAHSTVM